MTLFLQILYTVLVLSVLIFIHELGHFIAAKACGVRVTEFALGMGPALLKFQGKGKNILLPAALEAPGGFPFPACRKRAELS